jgi:hypothetical protein
MAGWSVWVICDLVVLCFILKRSEVAERGIFASRCGVKYNIFSMAMFNCSKTKKNSQNIFTFPTFYGILQVTRICMDSNANRQKDFLWAPQHFHWFYLAAQAI